MAALRIVPAGEGSAYRAFLDLPFRLYAGDPWWVPPLRTDVKGLLSHQHPFWKNAERELFLALDGDRPVGRVAAILNRNHDRVHGERAGFFGFFECEDDDDTARALLGAAEGWLRQRGAQFCRGPVDPSTNEVTGLLVEGFASSPFLMMPYQPLYYQTLLAAAGYAKAKDLLAFYHELSGRFPEKLARVVEIVGKREPHLVARPLDMRNFERDLALLQTIYNQSWEKNWGFVPMTEEEILHMAAQLKPLVVPELALFAEKDGEPVGFLLLVPDYNRVLKGMRGRLTPLGLLRVLGEKRRPAAARLMLLGVRPAWRKRGAEALLFSEGWKACRRMGIRALEFSWILEDNLLTARAAELWGAVPYKRYRLYQKDLGP